MQQLQSTTSGRHELQHTYKYRKVITKDVHITNRAEIMIKDNLPSAFDFIYSVLINLQKC